MAGINRYTGQLLDGFPHVLQSIVVIFTTAIGSRVMRRKFGSTVPALFGENLTPNTIGAYVLAICVALDAWEPRFQVIRVDILQADNLPDQLRSGRFAFAIRGRYYPRGQFGDKTVDPKERTIYIGQGASNDVLVI